MMRPPSTPARTPRRQSATHTPAMAPHVGQQVTFEVAGEPMTGTLRFVGQVDGKAGEWAGVELDDRFAGRGKNDGSVQGQQYFACPPQCGLFLPLAKVQPKKRLEVEDLRPQQQAQTPRPRPRPSLPTSSQQTPTRLTAATPTRLAGPRSSIGATPSALARSSRASLGGGTPARRPPSRQQQQPPEVPPIPSAYGLARSMTPSSATGRVTPALSRSETPRRRASMAPPIERPVTPSLRSSSRQSFASSVSRQSHRSSLAGGGEDASELRHLLDASERLGREMEDRLVEKSKRIKELEEAASERERRFEERVRQLEAEAHASQLAADRQLEEAQFREAERRETDAQRSADSHERKYLAKEAEIESLRERLARANDDLARANDDHARVAGDLQAEVDKLRKAGQALCETYEEKIAEIELARLEALDLVDELRSRSPATTAATTDSTTEPATGAAAIDAENARAEVEHLRAKVATLEEQLEDIRAQLEQEIAEARDRRQKAIDSETSLKEQIRLAQADTDSAKRDRDRLASRVRELEAALSESQTTLEAERSELESLREDSRGGEALTAVKADLERSERETAQLTDLVARLREDLRQADRSSSSDAELARLKRELEETQRQSQAEIKALKAEITELESLVENKIYQEDELVSELETLRSGKTSTSLDDVASTSPPRSLERGDSQEWCDDCEASNAVSRVKEAAPSAVSARRPAPLQLNSRSTTDSLRTTAHPLDTLDGTPTGYTALPQAPKHLGGHWIPSVNLFWSIQRIPPDVDPNYSTDALPCDDEDDSWYMLPSFVAPMEEAPWDFDPDEPQAKSARAIWLEAKRQQEEAYAQDRVAELARRQGMTDEERRTEQNRKKKQRKERAAAERARRNQGPVEMVFADGSVPSDATSPGAAKQSAPPRPPREIWALPISVADESIRREFLKWYTGLRDGLLSMRQHANDTIISPGERRLGNTYMWPREAGPRTKPTETGLLMQDGVYAMHCQL